MVKNGTAFNISYRTIPDTCGDPSSFIVSIKFVKITRNNTFSVSQVRDVLVRDGEACIVRYEQNRDEITIHSALLPDIDFFTYNFRVHFNLE